MHWVYMNVVHCNVFLIMRIPYITAKYDIIASNAVLSNYVVSVASYHLYKSLVTYKGETITRVNGNVSFTAVKRLQYF